MKKENQITIPSRSLVREANEFIESQYRFGSIWEERIFLMTLAQIRKDDKDFREYRIYVNDVKKMCNLNDNDIYKRLREAARSLRKREITIAYRDSTRDGVFTTGIFTGFGEGIEDISYISVELHPKLKPYFLEMKERYTLFDITFLLKIQSSHSRRIYRLLKQYQKLKKRRFIIEELKTILQITEGEYKQYYDFKRRVILKAQKDLAKYTDITFTFEEEKKGRKTFAITFFIFRNEKEQIATQEPILKGELLNRWDDTKAIDSEQSLKLTDGQEKLYKQVQEWITLDTLLDLLKKRTEAHIWDCIKETKAGINIKNEAAYFLTLVKKERIIRNKKWQEPKNDRLRKEKEAKQERKKQLEQQKVEKFKAQQVIAMELLKDEAVQKQVIKKLQHSRFVKYDSSRSLDENMQEETSVRVHVLNVLVELWPNEFEG